MSLRITFLGTGGAFTDFRVNYHNNALIHTDAGPVLIDCGPTACQSLRELGRSPHDLAAVLITHCHGDHINGLEQVAWMRFYTPVGGGPGMPPFRTTPLWATSRVLEDVRTSLWACMDEWTDFDGAHRGGFDRLFELRPLLAHGDGDAAGWVFGGVRFALHFTPHVHADGVRKPCFGVHIQRVDDPAQQLYFTSDTTFRADIGERTLQG